MRRTRQGSVCAVLRPSLGRAFEELLVLGGPAGARGQVQGRIGLLRRLIVVEGELAWLEGAMHV
jgi:hypothetical protein